MSANVDKCAVEFDFINKWSSEDKKKFTEDWVNDSFLSDPEIQRISAESNDKEANATTTKHVSDSESKEESNVNCNDHATTSSTSNQQNAIVDGSNDGDSVINQKGKRRKGTLDSDCGDSKLDDESGEDSEVNFPTKNKKRQAFLDSQSQENDSEAYQVTYTSSVCDDSDGSNDGDSVINQKGKRRKRTLDSDCGDSKLDDESGEDSEVNFPTKNKKRQAFLDSQSQENDSEAYQVTYTSSVCDDSVISTAEDIEINENQSSQDVTSDLEQPYSSEHDGEDCGDEDFDVGSYLAFSENMFTAYLQYMLSFCLDQDFLNDASSQHHLKVVKTTFEYKIYTEVLECVLKSKAWQPNFKTAMETFPILQYGELDLREGCEACARPKRIASKILTFTGSSYDMENFDSQETGLPNPMSFKVGRYCARRSKLYHCVYHYIFNLRQKCVEAINKFCKSDETNDFVLNQCMDDKEWIQKEYQDFCSMMGSVKIWLADVSESKNKKWY